MNTPNKANPQGPRSFVASSLASMITTGLLQPTFTIKSRLQSKEPIPRSLPALYQGVGVAIAAKLPNEILRIVMSNFFRAWVFQTDFPTKRQQFISALCGGGLASAILFAPAELIMRRQQALQLNMLSSIHSLAVTRPWYHFMQGSLTSMVSGGAYTAAYYAMMPIMKDWLVEEQQWHPFAASIVSGLTCGGTMAFLSHPFDTIKATQHRSAGDEFVTIRQACSTIYEEAIETYQPRSMTQQAVAITRGYLTGGAARVSRLAIGTVLFGELVPYFEKCYSDLRLTMVE